MQAVRPEWATMQAAFTTLELRERIERIMSALEGVAAEVDADETEGEQRLEPLLQEIGRYVEWTVPDLVPARAEAAEQLVNVARFAARLLVQSDIKSHCHAADFAAQIERVMAVRASL